MAVLGPLRISGVVVVDAVGIEVPGHPVADFFSLSFAELAEHSYADPERYGIDPSTLPPEALRAMAGNRASLEAYAGRTMTDPTLLDRLGAVDVPTWSSGGKPIASVTWTSAGPSPPRSRERSSG